ncbi:MAG: ABC transporter permease [Schleiferiaceae bacterium]|nr:ABC transporter permease [Schleiferiaceae bacterium]
MSWWLVSYRQLVDRKLSSLLCLLLLSFGVAMITLMSAADKQITSTFENNIKGIDLVVGAKGSPLQIILSSVYHMDAPTGNISVELAKEVSNSKMVKSAIPLSFGDSYKGYRIVGTIPAFYDHYHSTLKNGGFIAKPFEVVVGSTVAKNLNLNVGSEFFGNHGLQEESIDQHDDHAYKVVGVLEPNQSVIDNLILTSLNSVWDVHAHDHQHSHHTFSIVENLSDANNEKEITALLVTYKSKMAAFSLPRKINSMGNLQAAVPAIEVNRLLGLLGIGIDTLTNIALAIVLISAISVLFSLLNTLKENLYELALIRSFGANPFVLFRIIIQQGLILAISGYILGFGIANLVAVILNQKAAQQFHLSADNALFGTDNGLIFLATIALGIIASIIPSIMAYRLNISSTLKNA